MTTLRYELVSVRARKPASILVALFGLWGCNGSGCNGTSPTLWTQFHGNISNQGHVGVESVPVLPENTKWIQNVGPTGFSSPVIAKDGTIYVSNTHGKLWGWNPDGSLRHMAEFPSSDILSSPAISQNGFIYFTYLRNVSGAYFSGLCSVSPKGNLNVVFCNGLPGGGVTNGDSQSLGL